ncbi:unnamed protein product [Diamesa serratosioi]
MSFFHWFDNVYTTAFTPRDYQVELLSAAKERNLIICLSQQSAKEFISLKLIQELSFELRRKDDRKITIFLSNSSSAFNLINNLTDLKVINMIDVNDIDSFENLKHNQVIIMQTSKCLEALEGLYLNLQCVNLIIIDDCHKQNTKQDISKILSKYYQSVANKPKIFGLAGAIHCAGCPPSQLGAELEFLESLIMAKVETASDIVTLLRYSSKPTEIILECFFPKENEISSYMRNLIKSRKSFIEDHRYDPSEIYGGGEFMEELNSIPDPKKQPLKFLNEFLVILDELGAYCADKAALQQLMQIEKLKIKTPYERHFLLLCLVSTTFIQIRSFCELAFQPFKTEKERINLFTTPKVTRIIEVIKLFKPDMCKTDKTKAMHLDNIVINEEKCDSVDCRVILNEISTAKINTLVKSTSFNINKIGAELEVLKVILKNINNELISNNPISTNYQPRNNSRFNQFKNRKKLHHPNRSNRNVNNLNEIDSLCGLIFCQSNLTTKTLFSLLCEVSRHDPELKFLNVQYTVSNSAHPINDSNEAETEHRKQEDVLKKFRMHECNLLITTAILEEGFDLPKCNLVVRWDIPQSYRSYVQCKSRARASNALHVIIVTPTIKEIYLQEPSEGLLNYNHKFVCDLIRSTEQDGELQKLSNERDCDVSESTESLPDSDCSSSYTQNYSLNCVVKNVIDNLGTYEDMNDDVQENSNKMVQKLAEYMEIEKMLLRKCENKEPPVDEFLHADKFTHLIKSYQPSCATGSVAVNLSTAISLINKYCAKLPSDTFTKLTPIWRCCKALRNNSWVYQYTLRLPLNSAMKDDILGVPMPTQTLARRVAALIACQVLHRSGELDDNLLPIGKEGFRAIEKDWEMFELDKADGLNSNESGEPRPGTTKRRQYYYKRIASVFSKCRPTTSSIVYLYHISMVLQCPIPEEQNTRGRKIYPPEESKQSFGILTTKKIPTICAFPIFTRSGEVKVSLKLISCDMKLRTDQLDIINNFIKYTFTNVLRLHKFLMLFDAEASDNSFFVVPVTNNCGTIEVDWLFLKLIQENVNSVPTYVTNVERNGNIFDHNTFKDAVVMPWYRNQDQPQYFYVAEICYHLSPESTFPGESYSTFQEYYFKKYGITIQNKVQPLLDVDHTSARLNFLTPRYVNRKGVALPTSSEETKRAKRENLEQKQILVPELCTIHPFPASLWRAAVCLPCIIYRINALLLADEIRLKVASDLGLGSVENLSDDFEWPNLDFGWTLLDVLNDNRDSKKNDDLVELELSTSDKKDGENLDLEKTDEQISNLTVNNLDNCVEAISNELQIGMWSNEIVADDNNLENLPYNPNIRYGSPTSWAANKHQLDYYGSDSDGDFKSDEDYDNGFASDESVNEDEVGFKVEFKSDHLAEAIETDEEIDRRRRKMEILNEKIENQKNYDKTKNQTSGFDLIDQDIIGDDLNENISMHQKKFEQSTSQLEEQIRNSGILIKHNELVPVNIRQKLKVHEPQPMEIQLCSLVPYLDPSDVLNLTQEKNCFSIDDLFALNSVYKLNNPNESFTVVGFGDIFDHFADISETKCMENGDKTVNLTINSNWERFEKKTFGEQPLLILKPMIIEKSLDQSVFSFDKQPELIGHPGPSPSIILQALTMSNANDGINLERLETIGDSFLKYAITTYLYCTYENTNEGKLSFLRSKQVSNLNLYRLGRNKKFGESMIATKFEPHDNWLPPCYFVPKELEQALIDAKIPVCYWNLADLLDIKQYSSEEICKLVKERAEKLEIFGNKIEESAEVTQSVSTKKATGSKLSDNSPCFIPYNLVTQHSIPDKSIADCVESLIGSYLIECGPRGALLFMAWLGIRVLPIINLPHNQQTRMPGSTQEFVGTNGEATQTIYGHWIAPKSPLLRSTPNPEITLELLLDGFEIFENELGYKFRDRSYLLQAMTHSSYSPNRFTDCYQRLEFLGDAVLDYLITRYLYEDKRKHSPGALTDLRSALVNNTIFASLAVRHKFHKYFRHLSPGLNDVIDRFVRIQNDNCHNISEEYYYLIEDECDEAEDVEVPKALGDVFESVAGAVFLDSNMSLDAVWSVYWKMMGKEIEQFSCAVPKSPIRELLEMEPETAKFGKPEKLADGRRVRVTVEIFGKGIFRGIGRNYRIAKCTAAKCALRQLKKVSLVTRRQ